MRYATSVLPSALVDAIAEAVAQPDDPRVRADVIGCVLAEIVEAVEWRTGRDSDSGSLTHEPLDPELTSLAALLDECRAHRLRMGSLQRSRERSISAA